MLTLELVSDQGELTVELRWTGSDSAPATGQHLTIVLAIHDELDITWWASVSCVSDHDEVAGKFRPDPATAPRLVEVMQVKLDDGSSIDLPHERLFLEVPSGSWLTGTAAEAERSRLEAVRASLHNQQLNASGDHGRPEYAVVMIADNLLASVNRRVPGIEIRQLQKSTLGDDLAVVLNSISAQLGFRTGIDIAEWRAKVIRVRPAAVIHMPRVAADSPQEAMAVARREALTMLDLLALRRGASPRLLAGVVGRRDPAGELQIEGHWVDGSTYSGNLLGGFLAGEDTRSLVRQWDQLHADPRTQLWLALYSDALADERWDYRVFRCFNLLEGIGTEVIANGLPVTDSAGGPLLQDNGTQYTTTQARGKVYAVLQRVAAVTQIVASPFSAKPGAPDAFWEDTDIWLTIRNAVAHRGAWELPPGSIRKPREVRAENAMRSAGHDGSLDAGVGATLMAIRGTVEATIRASLSRLL